MPEESMNIYKTARRAAGITQEAAAEQLGISVESVRAYETGQRIPPNDVVEQMVICYNAQRLAFQHLHETNALAARVIPDIQPRTLMESGSTTASTTFPAATRLNVCWRSPRTVGSMSRSGRSLMPSWPS